MSRDLSSALKVAGGGLVAAGALATGAVVGAAVERLFVSNPLRKDETGSFTDVPDHRVTVTTSDGVQLNVEIDDAPGEADDLTIVFAHGYALTLEAWHFQRNDLRGVARLVFYDQRSHGKSARAEFDTHHIDQLGHDLYDVIESVVPTGKIVLVGHSMGGMSVMALADSHPELFDERIAGVVLIATTAGGLERVTLGLPTVLSQTMSRFAPVAVSALSRRVGLVEWGLGNGTESDFGLLLTRLYAFGSLVPSNITRFVAQMISGTGADVITEFLSALQDHNKVDVLGVFSKIPTLIIVGNKDKLTPPSHSELMDEVIGNAELVQISDAGHMVILEKYEEVDALIANFINRRCRS